MEQISLSLGPSRQQLTVGQLTGRISELLLGEFFDIWVAGEISGVKQATSGHWYFTLKDEQAQIRCACFKMNAMRLRVKPQEGMAVLARGRVEVYPPRGEYQLIVESIEPQGLGALQASFELLKKKLRDEGLFDAEHKRELPRYPQRIGIVTSQTGAVIRDMLHILERRAPGLHIQLYPALVQGEGSVEQICRAIEYFSENDCVDVVIVGRGGGSLEDLWSFNEEAVARAIFSCSVPVISAVGHETDFTIADFVADHRAPTPSAAAEIVTQHLVSRAEQLDDEQRHLVRAMALILARTRDLAGRQGIERGHLMMQLRLNRLSQQLDDLDSRLRRGDLRLKLQETRARLDRLDLAAHWAVCSTIEKFSPRLERAEYAANRMIHLKMEKLKPKVEALQASLRQLSPLAILERGYAIVKTGDGTLLKAPPPENTEVEILLAQGKTYAKTHQKN